MLVVAFSAVSSNFTWACWSFVLSSKCCVVELATVLRCSSNFALKLVVMEIRVSRRCLVTLLMMLVFVRLPICSMMRKPMARMAFVMEDSILLEFMAVAKRTFAKSSSVTSPFGEIQPLPCRTALALFVVLIIGYSALTRVWASLSDVLLVMTPGLRLSWDIAVVTLGLVYE